MEFHRIKKIFILSISLFWNELWKHCTIRRSVHLKNYQYGFFHWGFNYHLTITNYLYPRLLLHLLPKRLPKSSIPFFSEKNLCFILSNTFFFFFLWTRIRIKKLFFQLLITFLKCFLTFQKSNNTLECVFIAL